MQKSFNKKSHYDVRVQPLDDTGGTQPNDNGRAIGSVFGYRVLQFRAHPFVRRAMWAKPGAQLGSIAWWADNYTWKPGENVAAHIKTRLYECFGVGTKNCTCGFYAYYSPYRLLDDLRCDQVVAVMEGYGHTTLHSIGFRAEKARIRGFVALRDNDIAQLTHDYYYTAASYYCTCNSHYPDRMQTGACLIAHPKCFPTNKFVEHLARQWGVVYYPTLADAQSAVGSPFAADQGGHGILVTFVDKNGCTIRRQEV